MQYLCLVYCEPDIFERMSPEEMRTLNRDSLNYDDALRAGTHYLHSNALDSVEKAVTVRVRNDRMSTVDGPFAETKEHLCGFILIEAADIGEAMRLASGIPLAKLGSIEVRPIYHIEDPR
jgi:hypothetical protein